LLRRLVLMLLLGLAVVPVAHAADLTPMQQYELGMRYMKRGYYNKALEAFNKVRNYHRDDPASVLAELAIADLNFKKGDYEQARLAYQDFARLHPRQKKLDYVIYREGLSVYRRAPKYAGRDQTATMQALTTWAGFATRFPDSEYKSDVETYLDKCRERLASKEWFVAHFYARRDAWRAVKMRTTTLLEKYPSSKRVPEALALRGEALHAWGDVHGAQGMYDALKKDYPDARPTERLARILQTPAGSPPKEETFVRPYRVSADEQAPAGGS